MEIVVVGMMFEFFSLGKRYLGCGDFYELSCMN